MQRSYACYFCEQQFREVKCRADEWGRWRRGLLEREVARLEYGR